MTSKLSRRAVLAGAAVSGVSIPAVATDCTAAAEDPVLPLYRQWVDGRQEWYRYADLPGNGDWDFPESLGAERRERKAYSAMLNATPTSAVGIAALVSVLWDFRAYRDSERDELRLIRGIWRGATGQNTVPPTGKLLGAIAAVENAGRMHHV